MALLFVAGVMNLAWVAAVAIYVAFEKLLPRSPWLSRATGVGLIVAGGVVLALGLTIAAPASLQSRSREPMSLEAFADVRFGAHSSVMRD